MRNSQACAFFLGSVVVVVLVGDGFTSSLLDDPKKANRTTIEIMTDMTTKTIRWFLIIQLSTLRA